MALSDNELHAGLTDVFGGAVYSILSIAYCLSNAAVIFTGPIEYLASYCIAVTLLSAAVGGTILALRSSLPFAVPGPPSACCSGETEKCWMTLDRLELRCAGYL
jgi:hypothetical protein